VIVSEETNVADYINDAHCGFVLERNNAESLAKSIKEALDYKHSGKWKEMSNRAANLIKEEFTWNKIAEKHIKSYA
jgi:glycosyltransferase involved in cell wall biosynthesis